MRKSARSLPDTNTIIRYLVKDDIELFNKAEKFFSQVKTGEQQALIIESVLAECIYVLLKVYKVPKKEAATSLSDILNYKGVANRDKEELKEALLIFADKNLDIVDCILCTKARNRHLRLFSFDKELNELI